MLVYTLEQAFSLNWVYFKNSQFLKNTQLSENACIFKCDKSQMRPIFFGIMHLKSGNISLPKPLLLKILSINPIGIKISMNIIKYLWVAQSHKVSSKCNQKQKKIINRTFFVNKQLTLPFTFLKKYPVNYAQNFRKWKFDLANSESGEKTKCFEFFCYISQLFVYKIHFWLSFVPFQDTEMLGPSTRLSW